MYVSPSLVFAAGLVAIVLIVIPLVSKIRRLDTIERAIEHLEDRSERTRLRLEVLSIRSNVLALVLISIVAFLQVGFEFRRSLTSANPSPAIEERSPSRLPDQDLQKQQHQQIIDAIRSVRPEMPSEIEKQVPARLSELETRVARLEKQPADKSPDTVIKTSPAVSSLVSLITGFGFFGLLACAVAIGGFLYFLQSNHFISRKTYGVAAASLAVGSLWGSVTLLKDVSLVKSADSLIKFELKTESTSTSKPQSTDINLDVSVRLADSPAGKMDCGDGGSMRIGPFGDGTSDLDDDERKKLRDIATSLAADVTGGRVVAVMLIGSADKRSLTPKTAKNFNSNQGLAQARVAAVRSELEQALKVAAVKTLPPILESYAGPTKTYAGLPITELSVDRAVQVCVLLKSEKP
jgi:hypothetical protein